MKIAVINTGGTISCVGNPLAPMTAQAFADASTQLLNPILLQQFPDLEITYLTNVTFPESSTQTLDSTNLQPTDWCIMAKGVLDNYAAFDGFVLLHGTDSMDFSGAALSLLLNAFDADGVGTAVLSKPVIITGSQVPMYYQASSTAQSRPAAWLMRWPGCRAFRSAASSMPWSQSASPPSASTTSSRPATGASRRLMSLASAVSLIKTVSC